MGKIVNDLLERYEKGKLNRRQLVGGLAMLAAGAGSASAADVPTVAKAISVNHIALNVTDIKKAVDFYHNVFGLSITMQDEKSAALMFGDVGLILRVGQPGLTHFMFGVDGYDADKLSGWLKQNGLDPRKDQDSFHVKNPDGLDTQVGAKDMRGSSQAPAGKRTLTPSAGKKQ